MNWDFLKADWVHKSFQQHEEFAQEIRAIQEKSRAANSERTHQATIGQFSRVSNVSSDTSWQSVSHRVANHTPGDGVIDSGLGVGQEPGNYMG